MEFPRTRLVDLAIWQDRLPAFRLPPVQGCQVATPHMQHRHRPVIIQKAMLTLYRANHGTVGRILPYFHRLCHLRRVSFVAGDESNLAHPAS